jgi:hypothetical protein
MDYQPQYRQQSPRRWLTIQGPVILCEIHSVVRVKMCTNKWKEKKLRHSTLATFYSQDMFITESVGNACSQPLNPTQKVILAGDFKTKHEIWDFTQNNHTGTTILKQYYKINYVISVLRHTMQSTNMTC